MRDVIDGAAAERLASYFHEIGEQLGNDSRRQSFAIYATGVLRDGERKSVEPIAARACGDPAKADAAHQSLLHFVANARWSDEAVRRVAAKHAIDAITKHGEVEAWIVDDTGMLKQGKHSVGVHRQYTGSAGKITNCQIAVTLSVATAESHAPIDVELYMPRAWTDDAERRRSARVPDTVEFKTKPQLALDMMGRAVKAKTPKLRKVSCSPTRRMAPRSTSAMASVSLVCTSRWASTAKRRCGCSTRKAPEVKERPPCATSRRHWMSWASSGAVPGDRVPRKTSRHVSQPDAWYPHTTTQAAAEQREELWLLVEWRDDDAEPANYFLSSLPTRWTKKQLIRIVMQRWRTERIYEDMKGELGLDHYEGRSFQGWHHHVSAVLSCYAFVVAERARRFPPSARDNVEGDSVHVAA